MPDRGLLQQVQMAPVPGSDGRSTVYQLGQWAAVNNGQPYVDVNGCWWSVTREEGWASSVAMRAEVDALPVSDGQRSSYVLGEARSIVLGGTVRAGDQLRLQAAMDQVTGLLGGTVREDTLTVAEAHLTRHAVVRRDQKPQVAKFSPYGATFVLSLLADDTRRLGEELHNSTRLPSTVGGLVLPVVLPFSLGSTVVSGSCSLVNPGDAVGPVRLRISGPVPTGPVVVTHANEAGALSILAIDVALADGAWLDVDMESGEVLANGTAPRAGSVTLPGFSGFDPGVNTWSFAAGGSSPAALLDVWATPAWP